MLTHLSALGTPNSGRCWHAADEPQQPGRRRPAYHRCGKAGRRRARASLHSYVSNLRKLLSGAGIDPREVLAAAPPGYRLNIAENTCDLGRFTAEKTAGVHMAAAAGSKTPAGTCLPR